ncbi:MAG: hypothetical protein ACKVHP_02715 [Verrucomicrobiales bacterium]
MKNGLSAALGASRLLGRSPSGRFSRDGTVVAVNTAPLNARPTKQPIPKAPLHAKISDSASGLGGELAGRLTLSNN